MSNSKEIFLTNLRNKKTSIENFRQNACIISHLLAQEALSIIETDIMHIETPLDKTTGIKIKPDITLVPILRSGMTMLEPFLQYFKYAKIGVIGIKRDEHTAMPKLYYKNIPPIDSNDVLIILDPMIATGGTGKEAIKVLLENGANQEKIMFASIINSKDGLNAILKEFPKIKILQAGIDTKLNKDKFIIPGLGDFGDRYYGTENK